MKKFQHKKCNAREIDSQIAKVKEEGLGKFPSPAMLESYEENFPGASKELLKILKQYNTRQIALDKIIADKTVKLVTLRNTAFLCFGVGVMVVCLSHYSIHKNIV